MLIEILHCRRNHFSALTFLTDYSVLSNTLKGYCHQELVADASGCQNKFFFFKNVKEIKFGIYYFKLDFNGF